MKKIKIKISNLIVIFLIIIIIAMIFASVISSSKKRIELEKFISEMEVIQENVNIIRKEYILWEEYDANEAGNFLFYIQSLGYINANTSTNLYSKQFNEIIDMLNSEENIDCWDENTDSILSNYFYFNSENLEEYFGLEDTDLIVIINFYTGNIIAKDGIEDINGKIIYRQYDSKEGNKISLASFNSNLQTVAEVIENNGLSKKIKITYNDTENAPKIMEVLYYLDSDDSKKSCKEFQDYTYVSEENAVYFTITVSGNYSFFIKDINYNEYKKVDVGIKLCNKPELLDGMVGIYWNEEGEEKVVESETDSNWYNYSSDEFKFANAKSEDGNYWVWIPRFIYNKNEEVTLVEFTQGISSKPTNNKNLTGYSLQETFSENDNLSGFWVSKFQVNSDYEDSIIIKPAKTLTILSVSQAVNNIKNLMTDNLKNNSTLMSLNEKSAIELLAESNEITISNDLIHYSGGGVNESDYLENTRYSSTGNIYGVYDLVTSENEITLDDDLSEIRKI